MPCSSIHFTHEPGDLPAHISHLQQKVFSLFLSSSTSTRPLHFRKLHMKRHIYKKRLSTTEPAGFRLRNSHLEAPVLTPDWMNSTASVTWATLRWSHCNNGWGLWLRGNIAHGSLCLFSDRSKKKRAFCMSWTQPKPPLGRPIVLATITFNCDATQRNDLVGS